MAWTPTRNTLNLRAMADNLLAYFNTNQADALTWANGAAGMLPFASIATRVLTPNAPLFPALQFADDNDQVDYSEDVLNGAYSVTFDVFITNANPSTATTKARVYAKAITSMIVEIPDATIAANTGGTIGTAVLQSIEVGFEQIKDNDTHTEFMQQFGVRATYTISGSAL